jgi:hypothetical protein
MKFTFNNLDANESAFFERELTAIKSRSYDIVYPEYKATRLIPVSTEAGPGAEAILYEQYDTVGLMKLIGNYADDLPASDVKGLEFTITVKSIGGSYRYNVQEVRNAAKAGKPLNVRKALGARRAYDTYVNTLAWLADGSVGYGGMYGLLFAPNIGISQPTTGGWASATADQIIADFAKVYGEQKTATKGVEIPDTVLLPAAAYAKIATTPRSSTSDTTILEFLKRVYPQITLWEEVNELTAVTSTTGKKPSGTAGTTNCLVLYKRSSDKLTLELPQLFEQFAPQQRNLAFVVPTHARVAGVLIYYPLSIYVMEGL